MEFMNSSLIIRCAQRLAWRGILLMGFLVSLFGTSHQVCAQDSDYPEYDEIAVFLMIQGVGGYEMNAIYMDDKLYVPVTDLFQILKINHVASQNYDSVSGFFLQENNSYSISQPSLLITVGNNQIPIGKSALFKTDMGLYLRTDLFGKAFGLNLNFNFRSLSLELKTTLELPVIKELRLEQMRKNVNLLKGEISVDTTLERNYHLFRGGMADWSVISSQASGSSGDTRASLALGAEALGGEVNVLLNYSQNSGFDKRQQQYRWRWANNDAKIVRQVSAGKIQTRSISSIYAPVIGISASNTPTTFRKSFGSYILSDYTEPGWTVELYINNVIVNYTTADASGFFSFEVPLVYGASQIMLKFYGPWGEERIREQTINVPYNFLPKGTAEYNVSSGIVRDSLNSIYSRAETFVGLHRNFTLGGGVEYLSSITTGKTIPFLSTSARFLKNFLFTGEYAYGVKARGLLNYRLPSNLVFELDYTNYVPGQKAISFNYLEERKASLSLPLKIGTFRSFARMSYKQNVLKEVTYSTAEVLFSTYFSGVSANISGFASWLTEGTPYIYSNIALGFKLGHNINIRPQAQVDITNKKLISIKTEIEKSFSRKAFLSLVYEENLRSSLRSIEVSFRYDLPFAQTSASARMTNEQLLTTESARGSFAFGSGNGYVNIDNRSSVGRGGLTITPFLDINHNNKRDKNEPIATGLNIRMNGGRLLDYNKDSLLRIVELEPYASYLLEIDDNSFENIAWQLQSKTMRIQIDPNQFKKIDIPVKVMGEVNGMVYLKSGRNVKGQGRIIINFYDSTGNFVNRVLSEQDGFYNYLGFAPGRYTAMVDTVQLNRLNMSCQPAVAEFEILPMSIGDIVDDISFTIISHDIEQTPEPQPEKSTPIKPVEKEQKPEIVKPQSKIKEPLPAKTDNAANKNNNESKLGKTNNSVEEIKKARLSGEAFKSDVLILQRKKVDIIFGDVDLEAGNFIVQTGAFEIKENAINQSVSLSKLTNSKCGVILEDKLYKVRFGYFATADEAVKCAEKLNKNGKYVFIGVLE